MPSPEDRPKWDTQHNPSRGHLEHTTAGLQDLRLDLGWGEAEGLQGRQALCFPFLFINIHAHIQQVGPPRPPRGSEAIEGLGPHSLSFQRSWNKQVPRKMDAYAYHCRGETHR